VLIKKLPEDARMALETLRNMKADIIVQEDLQKKVVLEKFADIKRNENTLNGIPGYTRLHDLWQKELSDPKNPNYRRKNYLEGKELQSSMETTFRYLNFSNKEDLTSQLKRSQKEYPKLIENIPSDEDLTALYRVINKTQQKQKINNNDVKIVQDVYSNISSELANTYSLHGKNEGKDALWGVASIEATIQLRTVFKETQKNETLRDLEITLSEKERRDIEILAKNKDNIVLLVDVTGSMQKTLSESGIYDTISYVMEDNPLCKISVYTYEDGGIDRKLISGTGKDSQQILDAIKNLKTRGGGDVPEGGYTDINTILHTFSRDFQVQAKRTGK